MLNIKGLRLSNRSSTGKYEYRDCFISKSICGDWFVAAALVGVKIPTGIGAKTLTKVCQILDSYLDGNSVRFIKELNIKEK